MKKIMKFMFFIGVAFLMIACSDDESSTTPTVVSVTGVSLNKKTLSMTVGGTETLSVVVSPTDATNKRVAWSSSKAEVASVDNQGVVTAHKAGDAVVTVKSEDGGKTDACSVTVTAQTVAVTSVKLDKSEAALTVGGTVTLVATVAPENATNKKMTWKSDKTDIATVDANGKVTGVKAGTATITVTTEDGNKTATCKVTVQEAEVKVTGVKLDKTELTLTEGGSSQLVATIEPAKATNQNLTWKSSNAAVAEVDKTGKVTGVKAGTATITVTTEDGNKTATCKVTVQEAEVKVTGVKLDKTELTLTEGGSSQLVATIEPAKATNQNLTWKSSNAAVAEVDKTGKVTGVKAGTATITVTTEDGNKTATCKVTVQEAEVKVTGVKLNKTELTLTEGGTFQFVATVTPTNATNKKITWKSSNTDVVDIDSGGLAGAMKEGTATITATTEDGSFKAYCSVTVQAAAIAVKSVSLNKVETKLYVGGTETLIVTISPSNATNKAVTWSSSKSSVASVDKDGTVTAKSVGTATITVTTDDGKLTANCSVTVEAAPSNNISGKGYENLGTW